MLSGYINAVNEDGAEISSSTQIKLPLYYQPFQTLHLLPWQMNMPRPLAVITHCQQNFRSPNTYFFYFKGDYETHFKNHYRCSAKDGESRHI